MTHKEYTISELVHEFGITARTIRYYEEIGLLKPRRTAGQQRIYSRRDRARLKLILRGKLLGFSLQEIAELIQLYEIDPTARRQYEEALKLARKHLSEIRRRIEEFKHLEQELEAAIEQTEADYQRLIAKEEGQEAYDR
ncbi:MAG: MerR family DNA-binding transcriptional regulator [Candidatus Carbobacillus sp.]|nr:MerR family DNA-binding transcriptional regulator [Candidatus Carbobacillus sp.]